MTFETIVEAIHVTLRDDMERPHLELFGPEARLNEDLYLDSILMLHLFLNLELRHGLAAPEEAIVRQDLATVGDLARLFLRLQDGSEAPKAAPEPDESDELGVHGEDYVDLKIHCFVSCVCAALKARGIDHRAFYFGVWDAEFAVQDHALRYHADGLSHAAFHRWFERLYGVAITEWYDHAAPKEANVARLLELVETRRAGVSVMAMLDLFHLPERENKFNQNPFPHYLMLETAADPDVFMVRDPDFRWEGEIARHKVLNAVRQPTVGGGYVFDGDEARPARDADVADWFEATFRRRDNPLVAAVRDILNAHLDGRDGLTLAGLPEALKELPVLAIRKYAYEHGFAFFWRALKLPNADFLGWADEIEALALGLKAYPLQALRLAETGDRALAAAAFAELDRLERLEAAIKRRLHEVFNDWRAARGLDDRRAVA